MANEEENESWDVEEPASGSTNAHAGGTMSRLGHPLQQRSRARVTATISAATPSGRVSRADGATRDTPQGITSGSSSHRSKHNKGLCHNRQGLSWEC